jgi:uncharacterized protein
MIKKFIAWLFDVQIVPVPEQAAPVKRKRGVFGFAIDASTPEEEARITKANNLLIEWQKATPVMRGTRQMMVATMDSDDAFIETAYGTESVDVLEDNGDVDGENIKRAFSAAYVPISQELLDWYAGQSFIGFQIAAIISQHWLVQKACAMPARDAVRKGYDVVTEDGDELDADMLRLIKRIDKEYKLVDNMKELVTKGRIFGIRIAIFKIETGDEERDEEFYKNPFNIDYITPGSYKGISQIDPYWIMPMMDIASNSDPSNINFYEPTWWQVNGKLYHRSHLIIYRHGTLVDINKPAYLYGGISIPQMIAERVYGTERSANEGPLLLMTKRTGVFTTDLTQAGANYNSFAAKVQAMTSLANNYATRVVGEDDKYEQFDTALADVDTVIMTQAQLVAAIAGVISTKLLMTQPKGFNATGEYEESVYHEELDTIQNNDMTPLAERHYAIAMRSCLPPELDNEDNQNLSLTLKWRPLDTPTAKELADTQLVKAQRDVQLIQTGAIDSYDVRERLRRDKDSDYNGLEEVERPEQEDENGDAPNTEA